MKICGHGTVLALPFFAAFRNFHISICSQIVDKLRLTRYYKGNPNILPRRCNHDRCDLRPLFFRQPARSSIEGQLRDCKDYAEKNGITVVGTYIDRAYSAKTDDRPDFQRMIKDSGKKIFDVVLVWKLDRFARNRFDAVNYKYQLEKNGVHLVSAMEPISQGPEGIMVESMLIGMAEYYSAELALKVARGERENALQCKYNGGVVPLGFTIGKEDRLYHIDPETAPIVQEIFTRYADGEPAEKIAASLNERGLRTRTGKPFVKNSFFQIFRNRRYIANTATRTS